MFALILVDTDADAGYDNGNDQQSFLKSLWSLGDAGESYCAPSFVLFLLDASMCGVSCPKKTASDMKVCQTPVRDGLKNLNIKDV
jgi:hypothetical protein